MNPRKAKETVKETATELGLDPFMVEDILSFYWREVRKTLTKAEDMIVLIPNLGSFRIKGPKALNIYLENYKRILTGKNYERAHKNNNTTKVVDVTQKIKIVKNLIRLTEEEQTRRYNFKKKKNGQSNQDLEEQK